MMSRAQGSAGRGLHFSDYNGQPLFTDKRDSYGRPLWTDPEEVAQAEQQMQAEKAAQLEEDRALNRKRASQLEKESVALERKRARELEKTNTGPKPKRRKRKANPFAKRKSKPVAKTDGATFIDLVVEDDNELEDAPLMGNYDLQVKLEEAEVETGILQPQFPESIYAKLSSIQ